MTTTMTGPGNELVYANNAELHKISISNIKRSNCQYEDFTVAILPTTDFQLIDQVEHRMRLFLIKFPKDFKPFLIIWDYEIINSVKMDIKMTIKYSSNIHIGDAYKEKRSCFLRELNSALAQIGIPISPQHF